MPQNEQPERGNDYAMVRGLNEQPIQRFDFCLVYVRSANASPGFGVQSTERTVWNLGEAARRSVLVTTGRRSGAQGGQQFADVRLLGGKAEGLLDIGNGARLFPDSGERPRQRVQKGRVGGLEG